MAIDVDVSKHYSEGQRLIKERGLDRKLRQDLVRTDEHSTC